MQLFFSNTGIDKIIEAHPDILEGAETTEKLCTKNIGAQQKLRKWSRGHQFVVRAGGHIDIWQPLYKLVFYYDILTVHIYVYVQTQLNSTHYIAVSNSLCCRSESPSQVFFLLLHWLTPLEASEGHAQRILAYDNMCNLDRLRAAQMPLPLPPPMDRAWLDLEKIIDKFHFPNHTGKMCKEKYSPEGINPQFNTQAGEQTFVWAARFKHILCSMTKEHHIFYLHRMVVRRNGYTAKCHQQGRKPILPKK